MSSDVLLFWPMLPFLSEDHEHELVTNLAINFADGALALPKKRPITVLSGDLAFDNIL
jgi:hypothetical protein